MEEQEDTDVIQSLIAAPFKTRTDADKNKILKERRPQPTLILDENDETESNSDKASFDVACYATYDWLAGSAKNNRLYCWPCLLFSSNRKKIWTKEGFFDFRILHAVAESHAQSKDHVKNSTQLDEMDPLKSAALKTTTTVKEHSYYSKNRLLLQRLVEAITYLCKENIVIHLYENDTRDGSRFKRMFDLLIAQEKSLKEHSKELGSLYTDMFPTLLKDVVETINHEILHHLKVEMKKALFFAVQVDNTLDVYGEYLHTIIVRYVDAEGDLQEHFLGFLSLGSDGDQQFVNRLISTIDAALGANSCKEKMISLSLCGSSIHAKELENMKRKLNSKVPSALLIHSAAHQYKVVLQQGISMNTKTGAVFAMIQNVLNTFRKTDKGNLFLSHFLEDVVPSHTSELHWSLSSRAFAFLTAERKNLMSACAGHPNNPRSSPAIVLESDMVIKSFMDSSYVFQMLVFQEVFKRPDEFYSNLKTSTDVTACHSKLVHTIQDLEKLKKSQLCKSLVLKTVEMTGEKASPSDDYINDILPQYICVFQGIVSNVIDQLRTRFADLKKMKFLELTDQKKFTSHKLSFPDVALESLKNAYGKYFKIDKLKDELGLFIYSDDQFYLTPSGVVKQLRIADIHEIVPESYKLFSLVATFPITNFRRGTCFSRLNDYLELCKSVGASSVKSPVGLLMMEVPLLRKLEKDDSWCERIINRFIDEKKNHKIEIVA